MKQKNYSKEKINNQRERRKKYRPTGVGENQQLPNIWAKNIRPISGTNSSANKFSYLNSHRSYPFSYRLVHIAIVYCNLYISKFWSLAFLDAFFMPHA